MERYIKSWRVPERCWELKRMTTSKQCLKLQPEHHENCRISNDSLSKDLPLTPTSCSLSPRFRRFHEAYQSHFLIALGLCSGTQFVPPNTQFLSVCRNRVVFCARPIRVYALQRIWLVYRFQRCETLLLESRTWVERKPAGSR